ncbi:uncharacterized protein LOC133905073 [Phragmites australis]|uniref:uncharacterized protein LOC133905073 n=1 Tax=Phragmites australis TaxID=29695 RepID=UPI002D7A0488|nr:uncharacterized protein LOC133905073 [Phragmites australis]
MPAWRRGGARHDRMSSLSPRTSMAPGTSRLAASRDIPEEVICYTIFSRLPFKLVTCLKTLSKHCYRQLTSDTTFAAEQARLCPSCPALIHIGLPAKPKGPCRYSLDVLSLTPAIVGVPSPGLDFLGCAIDDGNLDLLSSSNGLLCIRYTPYRISHPTPPHAILIANPATQQAQPIPGAAQHLDKSRAVGVGLVFNPSDGSSAYAHSKFMVVQASPSEFTTDTSVEFHFVIFCSDTGRWTMPDTTVTANIAPICNKVVYSGGVLYWDYQQHLLWFDVTRSAAGVIEMPGKLQGSTFDERDRHNIDASNNGTLMCTTIGKDGLSMYHLVKRGDDAHCWELKHKKGWKDIVEKSGDAFQFCCHSMKLRNGWQSKFYERWFVRPLGVESGRWVYLGVRQRWKTSDRVLRYDMDTGKVDDTGKELGNAFDMGPVFGYRNSMAALPPI